MLSYLSGDAMKKDWVVETALVAALTVVGSAVCAVVGLAIAQWPVIEAASRPAIITGGCTIAAAVGTALVVFWQLRKQAVNTITANKHNEAMKLKKEVYEELREACTAAQSASHLLDRYLSQFLTDLRLARIAIDLQSGTAAATTRARMRTLVKKYNRSTKAISELIGVQEKWEIIDPRGYILRLAIAYASDLVSTAWLAYAKMASDHMPYDGEGAADFRRGFVVPDNAGYETIKVLSDELSESLSLQRCYIIDTQNEMQNALLEEMFEGKKAPVRIPLDPRYRAVTLKDHEDLKRFFDSTEWGQRNARVQEQRRMALSTPQPGSG
jgi:hypothetical protein